MLGWDPDVLDGRGAFQNCVALAPAGKRWLVRFDCGSERKLQLRELRERWAMPLRVLGLWGDYHVATVLESLGGLLRVDFGGVPRWALPEEIVRPERPDDAELCLLYTSPSPRDQRGSRMPSSA